MMIRKFTSLLCVFAISISCFAKAIDYNVKVKEYSLESPRHTIWTHLTYLQKNQHNDPSIASKTMQTDHSNAGHIEKLAIHLKEILDYHNLFVIQEKLPSNNDYIDTVLNKEIYTPFESFPDIYLVKEDSKWLYSTHTIKQIPILHKEIEASLGSKIMRSIPEFGHKTLLFGVQIWQFFALLIVILIAFIFQKIFTAIVANAINTYVTRFGTSSNIKEIIQPVAKPISLVIIAWSLQSIIPGFNIPIHINHYLIIILKVFTSIAGVLVFYRLVDLLVHYLQKFAESTESTLDDQLVPIVNKSLKIFVVLSGSLLILQNFDIDVTALLAGLSIGGLAFALAAQDTIKNLFGSVMIFIDRPFQIGDWVIGSDFEGIVEEVGFRSTRIRTFANSLISIPNGKLSDVTINNMGKRQYRRYNTTLGIDYNTPPLLLDQYVKGLKEIVKAMPKTRKDYFEIHFHSYGDFSLNILVYIFFVTDSWSEELEARHAFNMEAMHLAKKLGIEFAFPTQTLKVDTFPGQNSLEKDYNSLVSNSENSLNQYLGTIKEKYNTTPK